MVSTTRYCTETMSGHTRRSPNVEFMLGQRRRWPNMNHLFSGVALKDMSIFNIIKLYDTVTNPLNCVQVVIGSEKCSF